ncbi:MAG TPA: hypothetical protein VKA19_00610 [Alphaproteobacteria bacterium]|nr:hypothetical protein [Alphaproteobacteria bacterium]
MKNFDMSRVGIATACTAVIFGAALIGGCVGGSRVVDASRPTVTYHFSNDRDLVVATNKARAYCEDYNAWPRTVGIDEDGDEVKFVCDRKTAYQPDPEWTDRHVSFSFTSHHDLVEATARAESYCRRYNAEPEDLHIHSNPDGSQTATFECEDEG